MIQVYMDEHPYCEACGELCHGMPHHIKSRGSGGGDGPDNLLRLCWYHHTQIHTIGYIRFTERWPLLYTKIAKIKYQRMHDEKRI